jgi:acetylornithine deacetylase/succinyl-diaminopimelate desuccinylase-like protein
VARLGQVLEELVSDGHATSYTVEIIRDAPPFLTSTDSDLVHRLSGACSAAGVAPATAAAAWYSDAGPFSATCREVVVFGPGRIAQAHTADEFIDLAELEKGREILARFLEELACDLEG